MSKRLVHKTMTKQDLINSQVKREIMKEIIPLIESVRTETMMLCFGATLAENGFGCEKILEILESVDDKMGIYNSVESFDKFRAIVIEKYGFDVQAYQGKWKWGSQKEN